MNELKNNDLEYHTIVDRIIDDYTLSKKKYEQLCTRNIELIKLLLQHSDIHYSSVSGRVKEDISLQNKIIQKEGKYSCIDEITDIVGIRIIAFYTDDVEKIAKLIEQEYLIDFDNSSNKIELMEPDQFGYLSLHYVVSMSMNRVELPEYSNFRDIRFEIQIRTILQHAWAEIEHNLGYKSKSKIPSKFKRDFARIAGLLELADKEFKETRDNLTIYKQQIETKLESNTPYNDLQIDKISLLAYINKSSSYRKLITNIANVNNTKIMMIEPSNFTCIEKLNHLGYVYIKDLDDLVLEGGDLAIKIAKVFYSKKRITLIDKYGFLSTIGLYYLSYAALCLKGCTKEQLAEYVLENSEINSSQITDILWDIFCKFPIEYK